MRKNTLFCDPDDQSSLLALSPGRIDFQALPVAITSNQTQTVAATGAGQIELQALPMIIVQQNVITTSSGQIDFQAVPLTLFTPITISTSLEEIRFQALPMAISAGIAPTVLLNASPINLQAPPGSAQSITGTWTNLDADGIVSVRILIDNVERDTPVVASVLTAPTGSGDVFAYNTSTTFVLSDQDKFFVVELTDGAGLKGTGGAFLDWGYDDLLHQTTQFFVLGGLTLVGDVNNGGTTSHDASDQFSNGVNLGIVGAQRNATEPENWAPQMQVYLASGATVRFRAYKATDGVTFSLLSEVTIAGPWSPATPDDWIYQYPVTNLEAGEAYQIEVFGTGDAFFTFSSFLPWAALPPLTGDQLFLWAAGTPTQATYNTEINALYGTTLAGRKYYTPFIAEGWFVSPTGTSGNSGSNTSPWSLTYALSHPAAIQPGDTIWLLAETVQQPPPPPPPPPPAAAIAHWTFEENAGSTTADISGNGHTGTLTNGTSWTVSGKVGNCVHFDGVDDLIDTGTWDITSQHFSITGWVNADTFAVNDARIISKAIGDQSADHYWMLSTIAVGAEIRLRMRLKTLGTTTTLSASSGAMSTGQWHHVAAIYDGAQMRLYLDGTLVGSAAKTGAVDTNPAASVYIGENPVSLAQPFDGRIDELRVYSEALTAQEILDLIP